MRGCGPDTDTLQDECAVEQRDAADERRLEPCRSIIVGQVIVSGGEVVRPSQLIASVRRLLEGKREC
jgi:hypothetical protein